MFWIKDKVKAAIFRRKREVCEVIILYFLVWVYSNILVFENLILGKAFSVFYFLTINFSYFFFCVYNFLFVGVDFDVSLSASNIHRLKDYLECPKFWNAYFSVAPKNNMKIWLCVSDDHKYTALNITMQFFQPSLIVLSRGLILDFNEGELETIIGHELGHEKKWTLTKHFINFLEKVTFSNLFFVMYSLYLRFIIDFFPKNSGQIFSFIVLCFSVFFAIRFYEFIMIFLTFASSLLRNYYSRLLEYLADISAVRLNKKVSIYADVLEKISNEKILDPFFSKKGPVNRINQLIFNLLRSHPRKEKRIAELERIFS